MPLKPDPNCLAELKEYAEQCVNSARGRMEFFRRQDRTKQYDIARNEYTRWSATLAWLTTQLYGAD
jgi:hypothetical protein